MNIINKLKNHNLFLKIYYQFLRKYLYRLKIIKQHINYTFSDNEVKELFSLIPDTKEMLLISGIPNINKLEKFLNLIQKKFPKHILIIIDDCIQNKTQLDVILNIFYKKQVNNNDYFNTLKAIYRVKQHLYFIPLYCNLVRSNYIKYDSRILPQHIIKFFQENNQYTTYAKQLNEYFCDAGQHYGFEYIYNAYEYILRLVQHCSINTLIMWNQFRVFHQIFKLIIQNTDTNILYAEHGLIPDTFNIEKYGQMGESIPAINTENFKNIKITLSDYRNAYKKINYFRINKANRYEHSSVSNFDAIKKQLQKNKPTILYAGQNDFESGILPYTDISQKFHSPTFKSSDEAALFLHNLSKQNNWNFIYKIHPIISTIPRYIAYPKNMIVVKYGNIIDLINICDVFVTILSQSSYISLINRKPVVMLGYNQLKNKDCTYEAYTEESIEIMIKQAIKNGYTNKQNQYFIKHIAQLSKYYG